MRIQCAATFRRSTTSSSRCKCPPLPSRRIRHHSSLESGGRDVGRRHAEKVVFNASSASRTLHWRDLKSAKDETSKEARQRQQASKL